MCLYLPGKTVNLSPYVNENKNVYLLISYLLLFIFLSHATDVYAPMILLYYVLTIVNVLDLPWHLSQNLLTLKLCYDARYNSIKDFIYFINKWEIKGFFKLCINFLVNFI